MITIGITGGIGSGKSIVSTLMELSGIPVYIADEESKRLTQKDLPIFLEKQSTHPTVLTKKNWPDSFSMILKSFRRLII